MVTIYIATLFWKFVVLWFVASARTCFPMPLVGSLVVVALTARCSTFQQTKKEPLDLRLDDKTSGCLKWKFQYYCFKISVNFKKNNKLDPPFTWRLRKSALFVCRACLVIFSSKHNFNRIRLKYEEEHYIEIVGWRASCFCLYPRDSALCLRFRR